MLAAAALVLVVESWGHYLPRLLCLSLEGLLHGAAGVLLYVHACCGAATYRVSLTLLHGFMAILLARVSDAMIYEYINRSLHIAVSGYSKVRLMRYLL